MPAPNLTFDLLAFQGLLADYIVGDAWFHDVPVITQAVGNVQKVVDEAISALQTYVLVDVVGWNDVSPNVGIPTVEIFIEIRVIECVEVNSESGATQKRALHTAQVLAALLKLKHWSDINPMVPQSQAERITETRGRATMDGYLLKYTVRRGWRYTPSEASIFGNQGAAILGHGGNTIASQ